MYRLVKTLAVVGTSALLFDTTPLLAQDAGGGNQRNRQTQGNGGGRGNRGSIDPAQMQQRIMDRYKEALAITNDDEWKIVQDRIQKVLDAQRDTRGGGGMIGGRRNGNQGADNQGASNQANAGQRRGGGENNPAVAALQKALDDNASNEVVDAKLAALRDSRKAAEAKLEAAREALKKIVTRKQEAKLVLMGLLK